MTHKRKEPNHKWEMRQGGNGKINIINWIGSWLATAMICENGLNRGEAVHMALFGVFPRFLQRIDLPRPRKWYAEADSFVRSLREGLITFSFLEKEVEKNVQWHEWRGSKFLVFGSASVLLHGLSIWESHVDRRLS